MRPHDKHTNSTLETEINPDNDSEYQVSFFELTIVMIE